MARKQKKQEKALSKDRLDILKNDFIIIPKDDFKCSKDLITVVERIFEQSESNELNEDIKSDLKFIITDYLEGFERFSGSGDDIYKKENIFNF